MEAVPFIVSMPRLASVPAFAGMTFKSDRRLSDCFRLPVRSSICAGKGTRPPVAARRADANGMIILRILTNAFIMAGEVAGVAALAAFAFYYPFVFAGVTAGLSFLLGMRLEVARLRYELPFYFGGLVKRSAFFTALVGSFEAVFKGLLAGVAALFTFAGTNLDRRFWVAVLFGVCVYIGAALLRLLSIRADALPMRWGYFRLAPLLGLLFSAGLALLAAATLLPPANVTNIGWDIIFNTPAEPSIEQVSELFFQLKQAFDEFIVKALSVLLGEEWARLVGIVISVNVLSGFVSAVYAALIAAGVRRTEDALL